MTWIHEHSDWPHFVWDDSRLAVALADTRHKQGRLLGRMESIGFDLQREASLVTLTEDVAKSSAIEGQILSPDEVRSSIAKRLGIQTADIVPVSRNVEGVVEMMLDATQRHQLPLAEERLFGWHAALFPTGWSGMHKIAVGSWRSDHMEVVSGPEGKEKVHFEAPQAGKVDREMNAFLSWFEAEQDCDSVLTAGIAHFWFVTIHPFDDGNGRIARAIADMALARAEGSKDRFYSMSAQFENDRKDYYANLEKQQRGSVDITAWLAGSLDAWAAPWIEPKIP